MFEYKMRRTSYIIIFMIYLLLNSLISAQITDKRGGIAFRVGGNQSIADLNNYKILFDNYGYKFAFAMSLGQNEFDDPIYVEGIKDLQANGHVLYDLTPNFRINYFITKFDPTTYVIGDSVDHVNDNKICLKFQNVDLIDSTINGQVNINGNTVSGSGFTSYDKNDYLYLSDLSLLVLISNIIDDSTLTITDVWNDPIDLGTQTSISYYYLDFKDVHMTPEALVLIGKETLKLAKYYGLDRPYRFILPGTGGTPWGTKTTELKPTLGDELGYISAQTYFDYSLKTYNEYNIDGTKPFGMTWGQFYEETSTIDDIKEKIADGIAKHYVLFNHNHFLGDYYTNTSAILQWCSDNNIPVLTAIDWTNILYNTSQDAFVNIFPPLNIDLDENGVPDGYSAAYSNGTLITDNDLPGSDNVCYSINFNDRICKISNLGGIEKGENSFEIYTKGSGEVVVYFSATGMTTQSFTFPANTTLWTKYDLSQTLNGNHSLIIPDIVSKVNISIYSYNLSGEVRIGGMSLMKYDPTPVELTSFTASESELGVELTWRTATEVNNYGFEIERNSSSLLSTNEDDPFQTESSDWETIGFIEGYGNSYSPKEYFFIDSSFISKKIEYRLKQIDTDGAFEYSDVVTINFSLTSVDPSKIKEISLDQNHPNPFNPSTIISYQLANSTNVSLKVFDIIGNEVATLINNEKQGAGTHLVKFNKNSFNLSSGVYFYQLLAGQYIETKKMLLLK